MMKTERQLNTSILIVRVLVGVLLMFHGFGNLLSGYEFIGGLMEGLGLPRFFAFSAFFGEIIAPVLIIIGFRARLASLVVVFTMFVAILMAHTGDVFALNQFGGWAIELQAFYLFTALAGFFSGAGEFALSNEDRWD